jgi:uncharacterized protein YdhG (YjbR/CyaY superfamily)
MAKLEKFGSVDAYIASCARDVQPTLQAVRETIHAAAPGFEETISYDMPALKVGGKFALSYAAWKDHISIYPIPAADGQLARDLEPYIAGKGTLRFPLDKPIPYDLIGQVVRLLIDQRVAAGT